MTSLVADVICRKMQSLNAFTSSTIDFVFTDIDDTLTEHGRLQSESYDSIWRLFQAGIQVIPVTGRPAGWCELIARLWPVAGVVGENGSFYFCYKNKTMIRHFVVDDGQRLKNQQKLEKIRDEILREVPGSAVASDQFCRLSDLAIDFCEDVRPLSEDKILKIVDTFKKHGAQAKVSSIHVNGWFGDYDKLSMCKIFAQRELGLNLDEAQGRACFVGDSPNDEPMFAFFKNSFAVANVRKFLPQMKSHPAYVSAANGGLGFAEVAKKLLALKNR